MDRDKPPFGPSGDSMGPPGDEDSWSDRDLNERARRAASEREVAERYRFARSEPRNPTITDDHGGAGDEPPRRSFERMGRFSRDDTDNRSQGENRGFSTPSARMPERERAPRMEHPPISDSDNDIEQQPAPKRPAFLNRPLDDVSRTEHRRSSFLDRNNDDRQVDTRQPSFLDRPEAEETTFDGDAYDERPQPVRRSFRGTVPGQGSGTPSRDADDLTDWSMASNERSHFKENDNRFERPDPPERRFDPGQSGHSRQESEPSSQASKDWRSSRFASRFSQPPKAYDLDEVADQEISFDPGSDIDPAYETPREAAPRYSEEDLVQKARARSRSRFGRSGGHAGEPDANTEPTEMDRYNRYDEPAREPEAPLPDQIDDKRAFETAYEADVAPPAEAYLPASNGEAEFESRGSVRDSYEPDAGPEAVDDFDYEPEDGDAFQDYMPQDDIAGTVPVEQPFPVDGEPAIRSADVYSMQAPTMHAPTGQGYSAPEGQAYDDEPLDPYEMEHDQDQRGYDDYDDYDTGGRHSARNPSMEPDDLRGDRPGGPDEGYAQYAGTFQDFDEKGGRRPVVLIGALIGVAVLAGGLIFAYQMFSPEGNDQVPVVKLEESPSKVAPNEPGGLDIPHQNKLIYDRIVGEETAVAEKVVPREEKVIELESDKTASNETADASANGESAAIPPAPDGAVPDGEASTDTGLEEATAILESEAAEEPAVAEAAAAEPPLPSAPEESIPLRVETVEPPSGSETAGARAAPPIPVSKPAVPKSASSDVAGTDASSGGPIQIARIPQIDDAASESLEPEALDGELAPAETAIDEPAAQPAGGGEYLIQIASFRSEPEAQAEFRRLQGKHSGLLESYGPVIQKADLGTRGIYYRLRVGPIGSKQGASSLCSSLIAAGEKDCLVRTK